MQAFDGEPFTAAMLHSRLVTMRWRLAFTPVYALLSERGGNSITLFPFQTGRALAKPESEGLAELEAIENTSDEHASMKIDGSPSTQNSQQQTVDTRVLLTVSVLDDAIPNVSQWASWLTTAAPWDATKIDVQVHSIFKSFSTLIVVSIPTEAWDRIPERPAYRFVGFIRSGDVFRTENISMGSISEAVPSRRISPPENTPIGWGGTRSPTPDTLQRLQLSKYVPNLSIDDLADPNGQSSNQRHKWQSFLDSIARFSTSEASTSPSRATLDQRKTAESGIEGHQHISAWPPEKDEQLMRARQMGLNWKLIASQYFPDKTANSCRKRHERLMEQRNSAVNYEGNKMDILSKAYLDLREQMWTTLADRVGDKWQNIEAKV